MTPSFVPDADLLIPAAFGLVPVALRSGKGKTVQFCSEYEPDQVFDHDGAESVYRMPIPALAVSLPLAHKLERLGRLCFVAQPGVDTSLFQAPAETKAERGKRIAYVYRPESLGYGY